MRSGTAEVDALAIHAPNVTSWAAAPITSAHVRVLHIAHEVADPARSAVLPPGLHPCTPAMVTLTFVSTATSDIGPFDLCLLRAVCRSGVRSRGFLLGGFVSSERAATTLTSGWGLGVEPADVRLDSSYASTTGRVLVDGTTILDVAVVEPMPIGADDVQFTATMSLARTPGGIRLVQVEHTFDVHRAERGRPVVRAFDADAWRQPLLRPTAPVAGSICTAAFRLPPVRFVCAADAPAFGATERVR